VLVASGIVLVFLTGTLSGLWFALIGWFLLNAAAGEGLMASVGDDAHAGPRIADVTIREPIGVPAGTSVERFLDEIVVAHRHVVYPVLAEDGPVGLVSFRDALRVAREDRAGRRVEEIMVPLARVLVLDADRPLAEAVGELLAAPLRRALVSADGRLAGMLSPTDALRVLESCAGREQLRLDEGAAQAPDPLIWLGASWPQWGRPVCLITPFVNAENDPLTLPFWYFATDGRPCPLPASCHRR
jgi:CBS domain-containing protein